MYCIVLFSCNLSERRKGDEIIWVREWNSGLCVGNGVRLTEGEAERNRERSREKQREIERETGRETERNRERSMEKSRERNRKTQGEAVEVSRWPHADIHIQTARHMFPRDGNGKLQKEINERKREKCREFLSPEYDEQVVGQGIETNREIQRDRQTNREWGTDIQTNPDGWSCPTDRSYLVLFSCYSVLLGIKQAAGGAVTFLEKSAVLSPRNAPGVIITKHTF